MAPTLPKDFIDLYTASTRINGEVNVMGRVTHFMAPVPSRGSDMMSTFSIADETYEGDGCDKEGLKIRFFKPSESELPQIRSTGDVVLLRKATIKDFKGVVIGLSSRATSWIVFPAASIPDKAPPNRLMIKSIKLPKTPEVMHSEMLYAIELCNLRDRNLDKSSAIPISSTSTFSTLTAPSTGGSAEGPVSSMKTGGRPSYSGRDKFSLIKDLLPCTYYDIVGQVVKLYSNSGHLDLYITDYTSNNMLFRYEWDKEDKENDHSNSFYYGSTSKSKKWPGPYGQNTLMVAAWPPHSDFAQRNVNEWNFVLLQNVHIKMDRDGKMEGALHEDRRYPTKIQITVLDDHKDERVKDVLRRKREYNEKFKTQSEAFIKQARWQSEDEDRPKKPLSSKTARKKRKLAQEQQAAQEKASKKQKKNQKQQHREEEILPSSPQAAQRPPPKPTTQLKRSDLNKNVHSSHLTTPPTPLSSILSLNPMHETTTPSGVTHTLPFQNNKYRATVRVVDFFPADIADFAVRGRKSSEFEALSDYEGNSSDDSRTGSENEEEARIPPDSDDETGKDKDRGGDEEQRWEWRFALILEDADEKGEERARMTVYIAEQDGDFLLKEDAVDLRTHPTALDTLREKLFLLWGDLEERKTAQASDPAKAKVDGDGPKSKAFECCLQEYGVRVRASKVKARDGEGKEKMDGAGEGKGWERRFRMFGTTII